AGAILVCGGLGGVMEAAARGAARRGGMVVGLLPTYRHADGNAHLTVSLPTGLGHARNILVAAAGDAVIALPGLHGTLAEVAPARRSPASSRPSPRSAAWPPPPRPPGRPAASCASPAPVRRTRRS